ncbi:MAG: hypothetical protein QNJ07_04765 [Woeseiaceae bacterium]|nr:hypothetical protein [Woeseiaceae bacterium]
MTTTRRREPENHGIKAVRASLIECCDEVSAVDRKQLRVLDAMIVMATDRDWELPQAWYRDIRDTALACCVALRDRRRVPASVADVAFALRHELHAYKEFCEFRNNNRRPGSPRVRVSRLDWLESKRREARYPSQRRIGRIRPIYRQVFARFFCAA